MNSYTTENVLKLHKPKCEINDLTTIGTSPESHLHWKKQFHKKPLHFRIIADFEADYEIDNSRIGNKTTNIYKQNPELNGYDLESEMEDVLKSGYYISPLGYDYVDWFVDEVKKLENKMAFYFKNTKKYICDRGKRKKIEKDFNKLLNNSFYGKIMENVRNRVRVEIIRKDDTNKIIKQQPKLTFNGNHQWYGNYDSYTFKQIEVSMVKLIYLGFSVFELSKLLMFGTHYNKLQPYFKQEKIQLNYMDTDNFVLSVNTKYHITDLKKSWELIWFQQFEWENHELFSNKNKKKW